jgi:hypothetical protein
VSELDQERRYHHLQVIYIYIHVCICIHTCTIYGKISHIHVSFRSVRTGPLEMISSLTGMYLYIFICIYIYIYNYMYVYIYNYMHRCIHMSELDHRGWYHHLQVCIYTCLYICIPLYTYILTWCLYVCIYMYVFISS